MLLTIRPMFISILKSTTGHSFTFFRSMAMPISEQTADRLAALEQLSLSLASVCRAAITGADSDDPRVDPLMGTVRKIFLAASNLGSDVARVSSTSTVLRRPAEAIFTAISVEIPADLVGVELSLRQFQNAINELSPETPYSDIVFAFNN